MGGELGGPMVSPGDVFCDQQGNHQAKHLPQSAAVSQEPLSANEIEINQR